MCVCVRVKSPYSNRAMLLAKMHEKAAHRGFTSWDDQDMADERVVPLVLGARPGTKDYSREFKNLRLGDDLPQAALDDLPTKTDLVTSKRDLLALHINRDVRKIFFFIRGSPG